VERPGDAEVGDLGRALLVDEHVLGLDVPVDDVARVGGTESPSDLDPVGDRLGDRQAAHAADPLLERLTLDVLEHDVRPALVLAGVDHADDVGMRELGDGARFAPEALELIRVRRNLAVHELDRDLTLERGVQCAVDRRHPARANPRFQSVAAGKRRAEDRAHPSPTILRYLPTVGDYYYTDLT